MKKVFSILAIAATILAVSCKKSDPGKQDPSKDPSKDPSESPAPTPSDDPSSEPVYEVPIKIDGDFSDWAKLDESKCSSATLQAADTWAYPEIKSIKAYADELYFFVYFEFNKDVLEVTDASHFAIYINGDNDTSTGGYLGQWLQGTDADPLPCIDVLVMGDYHDGESWVANPGCDVLTWSGEANADGWTWAASDVSGFAEGACTSEGMEFAMIRDLYPAGVFADEFTIGCQLQTNGWDATGALPNGVPSDDNPSGKAPLLKVVVNK